MTEEVNEKRGGEGSLEEVIPDIWPNGPKGNHLARWLVFKAAAWVTVTCCCVLYYVVPLTLIFMPLMIYLAPKAGLTVLAFCATSVLWPSSDWPAFRRIFQHLFGVLNVRTNFHDVSPRISRQSRYIYALHPHAIVPVHALTWCAFLDRMDRRLYGVGGMANAIYFVPIICNIFRWLSNISASYKTLKKAITKDKKNVLLLPDGIAGIYYSRPGVHTAVLKKRRGLFRLATETGASILPVYCFGASDMLDQAVFDCDSFVGRVSRKFKVSFTVYWGQFGLPIPFPVSLSYVFGEPVAPPKAAREGEEVDKKAIEDFYDRYVASLRNAFDKYKAAAGYPDAELQVV